MAASVDELCRRAVELGLSELGFDRVGLWLFEPNSRVLAGTYGTDEAGRLRDERGIRETEWHEELPEALFSRDQMYLSLPRRDVHFRGECIGEAEGAVTGLWDGEKIIGLLCCDNLLSQEPVTDSVVQLLALYGASLGHLLTRKRAEDDLRNQEQEARLSNQHLTALVEVINELSIVDTFDNLCRRAIELGREKLGFDRLGLWFRAENGRDACGSFGTDAQGNTRDERDVTLPGWCAEIEQDLLRVNSACMYLPEHDLFDFEGHIGCGESVFAPLREGNRIVGFLASDNLLTHRPYTEKRNQLLVLYASVLGHLCARKQSEEQLRQSEERYRQLVDNVDLGITHIDADYNIVATNEAHGRFYGRPVEAQLGRKCYIEFEGRSAPCSACTGARAMASGHPVEVETGPGRRVDGSEFFARIKAIPVFDGTGNVTGFVEIAEDITERRKNEAEREKLADQLRQAQKMEAVGQLAGGVAHDFNNLLQAIQGYTELAQNDLEPHHAAQTDLAQVARASEKATSLVRQLLAFSRREAMMPRSLDLADVIGGLLKMLRRVIGEHLELRTTHAPDLRRVYADPGQIEQVLMNLCVNARDAMPEGGTITIGTENCVLDGTFAAEHPLTAEGHYVLLTVSDTGSGIPPEDLQRIFEPFFTTKDRSQGTGLGLATVYGIVSQHEGFLLVDSTPGLGTSFKVYLPVHVAEDEAAPASVARQALMGGTETILVAEDDEFVRAVAVRVLESAGYRVLVACDGDEALSLFEEHADEIQAMLLDVVMPKKSGRVVHDR